MWVEFWNNVATAPFSALIPDMVPKEQRGSASGWLGLMNMLGNFAGGIAGLIFTVNGVTDITGIYYFLAEMPSNALSAALGPAVAMSTTT